MQKSIAVGKDLPQDQELGVCVWALREQTQIYRKPDPERKRGKKAHYFDNTYLTCHSKILLNCNCLVTFQTVASSSAMVGKICYLQK